MRGIPFNKSFERLFVKVEDLKIGDRVTRFNEGETIYPKVINIEVDGDVVNVRLGDDGISESHSYDKGGITSIYRLKV